MLFGKTPESINRVGNDGDSMTICENIEAVRAEVKRALQLSANPNREVKLVAVTKTRTPEQMNEVLAAGVTILGENRVQEMMDKYEAVSPEAEWHIIGHLQSNKVKYIADKVTMIHSLESISLADEIDRQMQKLGRRMDCLVQVNIADEESKFGLPREEVIPFLQQIQGKKGIHVCGLMNIAPNFDNTEMVRPVFREMKKLFDEIAALQMEDIDMQWLSMGMSQDYPIAVEEGANMIRVGRRLFI